MAKQTIELSREQMILMRYALIDWRDSEASREVMEILSEAIRKANAESDMRPGDDL
jgi:hypothetical protein